uniref:Uncharacterized protein n=1 Tax=Arundo donax TaxID=35708 RepID=A0A0A8ZYA6_ARUDO
MIYFLLLSFRAFLRF